MVISPKSRTWRYAVELMRAIIEAGFTHQINKMKLAQIITVVRGGDPRTIENWIQNLVRLGFLKMDSRAPGVLFYINYEGVQEIPELLNIAVKRGQKKLM